MAKLLVEGRHRFTEALRAALRDHLALGMSNVWGRGDAPKSASNARVYSCNVA
jgi:hypothetical protein